MDNAPRNHLWYSIEPKLKAWLIPSQIEQLEIFQNFWNLLTIIEKCLLIRLMIDWPQDLCFTWQDVDHLNVHWPNVNNAFQHIQQTSFLTYVQTGLQQNDIAEKYMLHLGIINQIKRVFHFDMTNISLKKIKLDILWLIQISPFVFIRFMVDVVYRPIWISLDECPQKFPEISIYASSQMEIYSATLNLKYKSRITARLYKLQLILIRKCWNHLQSKINAVEQQVDTHLNLLSRQLLQL